MSIYDLLSGLIEIEITSAEPEKVLNAFRMAGIDIRKIQKHSELTYTFVLPRKYFRFLKKQCEKFGVSCTIRKRIGVFWYARNSLSRPILLLGGIVFVVIMLWLPTRVLFIRVEGNSSIPSRKIMEAAENCGITFGSSRRKIRSEKTKNALLQEVPQLQWAGVNTAGCTAIISVREKEENSENKNSGQPADICAVTDGYVLSCTATAGRLLVKPGDPVREGQTLISAFTDCGICIRAEHAAGDILAQTIRNFEAKMPTTMMRREAIQENKRKYSLLVRKKRIFLWKDSGIWDSTCGRMYEEYYITLPGGFQLPIAFCIESYSVGQCSVMQVSQEGATLALKRFSDAYLQQHMVAGKIRSRIHTVESSDGCYTVNGNYICEEMIGTIRQMQIGDRNGKND